MAAEVLDEVLARRAVPGRPADLEDEATVGIVYALLTYILGFVALEIPRAGTSIFMAGLQRSRAER
jgi:hypothetical protein